MVEAKKQKKRVAEEQEEESKGEDQPEQLGETSATILYQILNVEKTAT